MRSAHRSLAKQSLRTVHWGAFLFFAIAGVQGQDDYVTAPQASGFWASAYVASGGSNVEQRQLVMADYRILLEGSIFSQEDLSAYDQNRSWQFGGGRTNAFVFGASIHPFRSNSVLGPELRMGINYMGGGSAPLELTRSERYTVDTLSSGSSGLVYYVDSTFTSRYLLQHGSERVGLDASLVFRTGPEARWSIFGGAGLGIGARFNAHTTATLTQESATNRPAYSGGQAAERMRLEQVDNSGGLWVLFYAPIGLGFRIAKENDFWNRMELYLEGRPGMMVQGTQEFGTITSFGSQTLFGLRLRLG